MFRSLMKVLPFIVVFGALAMPRVAGAANILTNPGFESPCPGAACGWTFNADSVSYDTVPGSPHSGMAALTLGANANHAGDMSQCVAVNGQAFDASVWYQLDDPAHVGFSVAFYSQPGCAGNSNSISTSGEATGGWNELTAGPISGAGSVSALVKLYVQGIPTNVSSAVDVDDFALTPHDTTAATMRSFTASRSRAGTLLRWRTASEIEVAGFNVYRLEQGRRVKVNRHLIAAKARGGASYRLLDHGHRAASYRLEVVNLDGTRQWRTVR